LSAYEQSIAAAAKALADYDRDRELLRLAESSKRPKKNSLKLPKRNKKSEESRGEIRTREMTLS
jgi:hypothetical protein